MSGFHRIPVFATALLLGACEVGPPPTLHCGDALVTVGDNSFALTQRCGQPAAVDMAEGRPFATPVYDAAKSRHVIQFIPQPYQVWTYDLGPTRPRVRVSIKDGVITEIEEAQRGP